MRERQLHAAERQIDAAAQVHRLGVLARLACRATRRFRNSRRPSRRCAWRSSGVGHVIEVAVRDQDEVRLARSSAFTGAVGESFRNGSIRIDLSPLSISQQPCPSQVTSWPCVPPAIRYVLRKNRVHVFLVAFDARLAVGIDADQPAFDDRGQHQHLEELAERGFVEPRQMQIGRRPVDLRHRPGSCRRWRPP